MGGDIEKGGIMAENGIVNNLGVSKRSATGITAMVMLMKLSGSGGEYVLPAMIGITVIAIGYMVLNEIKEHRHATQGQKTVQEQTGPQA